MEKIGRCCTTFRVLRRTNGHCYQPIPAERCRHRLCPKCAHWRQQRAITRLRPAIRALRRRHPEDRWVFITLTTHASDEPLHTVIRRLQRWFARLRRTTAWKTAIRGAIAGIEVTYRPGRGWHAHVHLLASRQAWWNQAALAATWHRVTDGHGLVVDIRDRNEAIHTDMCRTLTYPFKPTNFAAWGPAQVAEFTALGRTKLAECYGAVRGLATAPADDGTDPPTPETPAQRLTPGSPCPRCRRPLAAQWVTRQALQHARPPEDRHTLAPPGSPHAA